MLKYIFSFLLLFSATTSAFAQSGNIMDIQPICSQEQKTIKLLSNINAYAFGRDEVILFHFTPNSCPRCEGSIWGLANLIKKQGDIGMVLMIDIDDVEAGKNYLQSAPGFDSRLFSYILYDVNGSFKSLLNVDQNKPISYPLVYKLNKRTGAFLFLDMLGGKKVNETFAKSIINSQSPITACQSLTSNSFINKPSIQNTIWSSRIKLSLPEGITLPMSLNGSNGKLYFTDLTTGEIVLFNNDGTQINVLKSSKNELYHLIDTLNLSLMDKIKKDFMNTGYLKVIYRKSYFGENGKMVIAASIPKIWYTNDTNANYMNHACIISKDTLNNLLDITSMNIDRDSIFSTSHQYYLPVWNTNDFGIPIYKGWPAVGFQLDTSNFNNNPFLDSFYNNTPIVSFKIAQKTYPLGKLPFLYKEANLGYYYCNPYYSYSDDKLFLVETTSGELQVFDKENVVNGINKFKTIQLLPQKLRLIDSLSKQVAHSSSIEYLNTYKKILLNDYVADIKFINKHLYVLIKGENILTVKIYDSEVTRLLSEKKFRLNNSNLIKGVTIESDRNNANIYLFAIEKENNNGFYLCKIGI